MSVAIRTKCGNQITLSMTRDIGGELMTRLSVDYEEPGGGATLSPIDIRRLIDELRKRLPPVAP